MAIIIVGILNLPKTLEFGAILNMETKSNAIPGYQSLLGQRYIPLLPHRFFCGIK
jgi:hypothetical protein